MGPGCPTASPPGSETCYVSASSFFLVAQRGENDWDKWQLDLAGKRPWDITRAWRQEPSLPGERKREGRTLSLSSVQAPFIWEEAMDHGIAL